MNNLTRIGAYGAFFGTLAVLGLSFLNKYGPVKVEYKGFESYAAKGLTPVACQIDTQGKVTEVDLVKGEDYSVTKTDDGTTVIEGKFNYRIKPDIAFAPHADHSDNYGNTPENCDYWADAREGTVILAPKSLEAKVK